MGLLRPMERPAAYLKAGFLGFAGSGKTRTATELAIGTREKLGLKGPIAYFDTEGGASYVQALVRERTGQAPLVAESRSLDDLMAVLDDAEAQGVSVLVVDSISHVWKEVLESYMAEVNEQRKRHGKGPRTKLEFQDWGPIKATFNRWTDAYLTRPIHVIVCGRAGWQYENEMNEETGKRELAVTGTKMKAEGEFGFEPSLLVEMEATQSRVAGKKAGAIVRAATVLKDRFGLIDARRFEEPTFRDFEPHVAMLTAGEHRPVDTGARTRHEVDELGDGEWARERRNRTIYAEEIQGLLVKHWPGMSAEAKAAKADAIDRHLGTRSWTAVENMPSRVLKAAYEAMRAELDPQPDNPEAARLAAEAPWADGAGDVEQASPSPKPQAAAPAKPEPSPVEMEALEAAKRIREAREKAGAPDPPTPPAAEAKPEEPKPRTRRTRKAAEAGNITPKQAVEAARKAASATAEAVQAEVAQRFAEAEDRKIRATCGDDPPPEARHGGETLEEAMLRQMQGA